MKGGKMNDYRAKLDTKNNKIIAEPSCLQAKYRPADQENAIKLNLHHMPFHLSLSYQFNKLKRHKYCMKLLLKGRKNKNHTSTQ